MVNGVADGKAERGLLLSRDLYTDAIATPQGTTKINAGMDNRKCEFPRTKKLSQVHACGIQGRFIGLVT